MMTFGKDLRLNLVWVCQTQTVYLRVKYLKSCGTILSFVVSFLKCINFDRDTQDEKITPVETDLKASLNWNLLNPKLWILVKNVLDLVGHFDSSN